MEITIQEMKEAINAKLTEMGTSTFAFSKTEEAEKLFGTKSKFLPSYLSTSENTSVSFPALQTMYEFLKLGTVTKKIKKLVTTTYVLEESKPKVKPKAPRRKV